MTDQKQQEILRSLPAVDKLLASPTLAELANSVSHTLTVRAARSVLADVRTRLLAGWSLNSQELSTEALALQIRATALQMSKPSLRHAVNATGVVLHTGLGRSILPSAAVTQLLDAASGHSTLEIEPETGIRGSRKRHYAELLASLCGSESAIAVNNNAAAVFLALNTLAHGREVIISRGQLVEIGGSFRLPDIMMRAGVKLVEVGTTNRTRISDYEAAITDETALILRVHPSNFQIVGYTEDTPLSELVILGTRYCIPVVDDLGSGSLVNLEQYGLKGSPLVQESVQAGADAVMFSADKLLGGPQAGLIVGKNDTIEDLASNPIARALRVDKLTISALEATLRIYEEADSAVDSIPTLRFIARPLSDIHKAARRLSNLLVKILPHVLTAEIVDGVSEIGGGSLPGQSLPTKLLALSASTGDLQDPQSLAAAFRGTDPPIFGRVGDGRFLLDLRTVDDDENGMIVDSARQIFL